MPTSRRRNAGSALITALFIMTLVAIAATAMSLRLQLDIYRTRLTIQSDKLYLASDLVIFWAMSELGTNKYHFSKADAQGNVLKLPKRFAMMSPNLITQGYVYDLQGRFNLNNVRDNKYYTLFINLLKNAVPGLTEGEGNAIASATRQWIAPFLLGRGNDELTAYYLKQNPPYHQGQQLLQNVSEFRLIRGVNANTWQSLNKLITALPEITPVNLNTASDTLLMALGNLNETQLKEIQQARENKGGIDPKELPILLQKLNIRANLITLESQYFMAVATVTGEDSMLTNYAILKRSKDKDGKITVSLFSESLNSP